MIKTLEIIWLEHCNKCGCGIANVHTKQGNENFLYEGDKINCSNCLHTDHIDVTHDYLEDRVAFAVWDELNTMEED
ncbi:MULTISPECIES: hypothetical protein [Acinetobacter]|uniref:hypothetical protein n=1 Tax=Acinetobacter TaxID=469 RepID=UPI0002AEA61B|nr:MULTISPECIES: hypothetical protein [Acinetobacter]ELW85902.1 hypothetical protein ACINWC743_2345 [Acinetobacter sp. WC-743]MBJ8426723.1 hypothetical protein [Acinetobacter bereziniae]MBJ8475806.1 hypothetical protein [Acinetobacter bereziniae]